MRRFQNRESFFTKDLTFERTGREGAERKTGPEPEKRRVTRKKK